MNVALADGSILDNIWAIGDIISWEEQHQLKKALAHAAIVAHNILEVINAKETGGTPYLKEYKGTIEVIAVTLGPVSYFLC